MSDHGCKAELLLTGSSLRREHQSPLIAAVREGLVSYLGGSEPGYRVSEDSFPRLESLLSQIKGQFPEPQVYHDSLLQPVIRFLHQRAGLWGNLKTESAASDCLASLILQPSDSAAGGGPLFLSSAVTLKMLHASQISDPIFYVGYLCPYSYSLNKVKATWVASMRNQSNNMYVESHIP